MKRALNKPWAVFTEYALLLRWLIWEYDRKWNESRPIWERMEENMGSRSQSKLCRVRIQWPCDNSSASTYISIYVYAFLICMYLVMLSIWLLLCLPWQWHWVFSSPEPLAVIIGCRSSVFNNCFKLLTELLPNLTGTTLIWPSLLMDQMVPVRCMWHCLGHTG